MSSAGGSGNGGSMTRPPVQQGLSYSGEVNLVLFAVFTCFFSLLAVGLRFWARVLTSKRPVWNDWAAVIALLMSIGLGAAIVDAVINADLGAHIYALPDPETMMVHNLKNLIAYQIFWSGANTFARLSILHLYTTIFTAAKFKLMARILMGIAITFWLAVVLQTFLFCIPLEANWNPALPGARCGNLHAEGISTGSINLAIDMAVICLPMPVLWNLQLALRKKLVLVFIFGIGFFICALSIVRIQSLAALGPQSDLPYDLGHIAWWSILENSLSVINCCLPVLQPVVTRVAGIHVLSTLGRSKAYADRSYGKGSIQVTTEHKVEHQTGRSSDDDGMPLQDVEAHQPGFYPDSAYDGRPHLTQHAYDTADRIASR